MSNISEINIPPLKSKTGLIYDDRMVAHNCLWDPDNPEGPERYLSPMKKLKEYGLLQRCHILPSRAASIDELKLVHSEDYISVIKNSALNKDANEFEKISSKYDGVFINPQTYDCALLAAGCSLELVSSVLRGSVRNGLAIVRPPGHHADVQDACGYCFFNNIAIAAKHALEKYNLKRILIVDWDVHHGQATQRMFYNDPRVLYFSIHRYENGEFWPHLRESNFDFVGSYSANGFNINVPLNCTELGNAEYLAIFNNILLPIAYEFSPELILISAGYDAAIGCPEGEMKVTPPLYAHFLNSLSCLAGGKICVILEGGYCVSSLSESVAFTLKSLLGDPCPSIPPCVGIHESSVETILNVISAHRPFWDAIKLQNVYDSNFDDDGSNKHVVKIKYNGQPLEGSAVFETRDYYPIQPPQVIAAIEAEIKGLISIIDFSVPKYRTGFIFDPKIENSFCAVTNHADRAEDAVTFYRELMECRMLSKCVYIQSGKLPEMELLKDSHYSDKIHLDCTLPKELSEEINKEFSIVKFCQKDKIFVEDVCDKVLTLIDAVAKKMCNNGFALVRPIGHYPDSENASGRCIFSSTAVAAKYLITKYRMSRILIVDLDTQRGNSIQNFFYEDDRVLYISMYYHDGECFPTSLEAKEKLVGSGKGKGFNVNIPFSHTICDGDFIAALFHIIMPIAYEFCPEFVLISLGYDDGLNRTRLSASCIGVITKFLSGLSYGKIVVISESNFRCDNGPDTAAHCLSALLNESHVPLRAMKPTHEGIDTIRNVVKVHKNYWKSLAFDVEVPNNVNATKLETNSSSTVSSADLRRQCSTPVAIPKVPGETVKSLLLEYERGENLSNDGTFFCVTPLEYCPHLELLQPIPNEGLNPRASCQACKDPNENWVCLHCYQVYCGRFVNQHMVQHGLDMKHYLTLSYSDLSVWCYACDAYIHNNLLVPVKEHAHDAKFNNSHFGA
ncbi:histone deacetylase 6 [Trichonephila clavata]|uniref:Protein deacetylase HDAC6 n=1 Tax=Trichonephila clavata TaxID=2740835 RepID=A0A8X6GJR7_TRICU|nr:histone deacetylase 6 [Trichonephila clavata]